MNASVQRAFGPQEIASIVAALTVYRNAGVAVDDAETETVPTKGMSV